ncbi:Rid family detoxifying hydrolase [Spiroplasma alleghenense]|uniref:2-iminobutanoate/2-iminopropanoate deaminase n=1 Tax=Spiroplasma alleghenense TaxID=216931 RepID=A0A345Z5A3_9MOLU|nr:Rid family detoxifying hydrolase [Spiroplasma alleghenense]AXK51782.1 2-iminobutanoate/2-iminopropanoate deaminase [Spiroplasma alleghenense]
MKIIKTNTAPEAIGPYSQAIEIKDSILYTSGQLGFNLGTFDLPNSIEEQTKNALSHIDGILKSSGYDKSNVIKVLILLADINDFNVVNQIYADYFKEHKPARSAFQVAALPKNGLIEIEIIASK